MDEEKKNLVFKCKFVTINIDCIQCPDFEDCEIRLEVYEGLGK